MTTPQANAVFSDNVHGSYGAADCQNGDTCVEKVGDTAEVSWNIKVANVLNSHDHVQTTKGANIWVPDFVDDIKLEVTHSTDYDRIDDLSNLDHEKDIDSGSGDSITDYVFPMKEHNPPVEMKQLSEQEAEDSSKWGEVVEGYESGFIPTGYEMITKTGKEAGEEQYSHGIGGFATLFPDQAWKLITIPVPIRVTSLRLSGTVETEKEDTYIPIRVKTGLWRCMNEEPGPGSYEDGCQSLAEYDWNRTSMLPNLKFASDEKEREFYEKNTLPDGLSGSHRCAVTKDTPMDVGTIGMDVEPSTGHGGYARTFDLHANPAVTYIGALNGPEDLCDQAVFHVSLCDEDTSDDETPDASETPETTSPKRPGITIPSKTEDQSSIPTSPSDKPEVEDDSKDSKDSEESKDEDDQVIGTTSTKAPDSPDYPEEDTPVDKAETSDRGGFYPGSNPQPVNSTQTAGGSTISDETGSPVSENPEGIEVNTGGKVEKENSFSQWSLNILHRFKNMFS